MDSAAAPLLTETDSEGSFLATLVDACNSEEAQAAGWQVGPNLDQSRLWIRVHTENGKPPEQGWKLHVSASVSSAEAVLERVLPVLLANNAHFKVITSVQHLADLNAGNHGASQIGKFITVYPNDEEQAVRLAVALDDATRGLPGPAVPSDRRLAPDSLVHYRYGGFDGRYVQIPLGSIVPAIRTPDGSLEPDHRGTSYRQPEWVTDPFVAAGVVTEPPERTPLINDTYLVVSTLYSSPRSAIHLAVNISNPGSCILKQVRPGTRVDRSGRDDGERLRHEADVLSRLGPDPRFPAVFDLTEQDGDLFLAMEDVEGETLEQHVASQVRQGGFVPGEQVLAWAQELADMLATIHAKGFVYRDLKSPNVIVAPDGRLRLVDFELAHEIEDESPPRGRGTRGYMSPQQEAGEPPDTSDDIYGLGALLYFAATSVEPSQAPNPFALLDRPISLLNPAIGPSVEQVIARCLDRDSVSRFPSMSALRARLSTIEEGISIVPPPYGGEQPFEPEADASRRYRDMAYRLGDTICTVAEQPQDGTSLAWRTTHRSSAGIRSRDLNTGSGGTVLALAEIAAEFGDSHHREVLAEGAKWLIEAPRPGGTPLPGLYVGESGIGVALLRAGQVLDDADLLDAAAARGRLVASLPYASPDLFNGTAGRLRFHLLLWDETGEHEHLRAAMTAGETLLEAAEDTGSGGLHWTIPDGYEGLSGQTNLGYAHGAAGIADALLDLFVATGDERFMRTAQGAARWLASLAVPVLDDGSGLNWPSVEGQAPSSAFWCHGAAGIGRFFLRCAKLDVFPEADELADRAARTVARGTRRAGPTQCHGLAGNIEFLLDMYQVTRERAHLAEARSMARLLEVFAVERDGLLVWPSEQPRTFTPDYMVGYAGVAVCLLRLSDPERLPHQLSRRGFRHRRGPGARERAAESVQ